jgi:hypothetical protein
MRKGDSKENRMHGEAFFTQTPALAHVRPWRPGDLERIRLGRGPLCGTNRHVSETFPRGVGACARAAGIILFACVPAGNSTPSEAGPSPNNAPVASATVRQAANVMTAVFEDSFERPAGVLASLSVASEGGTDVPVSDAASADAARAEAASPAASVASSDSGPPTVGGYAQNGGLGPEWHQVGTSIWHIENGRLCGQGAHNHGVWLRRVLPINARIEFDAMSDSPDGDIKTEAWGDGQSAATSLSYTNATSYLAVLGGWKNTFHVLARLNEHGTDRKEIKIDPSSDDPLEKPVTRGQSYHFKIERSDGKTVRWSVDGVQYLSYADNQPLAGVGHDHFGFNDWEVKVCFDNVKVTPL